ncbi:hypothetical protein FRC05_008798 [Tulasnella sp. 425]|nr:hypothetical protein FRC05_008798 [Tulasnella sp. 425]
MGNLRQNMPKSPSDGLRIARQVSNGLAYLHGRSPRIIHGDIKPENILIGVDSNAKLADFGLSVILDDNMNIGLRTSDGCRNSPFYADPTLFDDQPRNILTDIWSLGWIIYEGLRRLQATNRGEGLAILRAIEMAFGRRGKLRRQLMLPLTSPSPDAPLIIPQNPKSRLPTYSPTLSTLVTSPHGRSSGKAITEPDTINPPILPARANPGSEDARLLGPFSKRREVNLRRRHWKEQVAAARVPLQSLAECEENGNKRIKWDPEKLFSMLERAATVPPKFSSPTFCPSVSISPSPIQNPPPTKFPRPARFLRRRFAEVLAKTPIIKTSGDGRMSVTISPKGIDTSERRSRVRAGAPSEESMRWIELATTIGKERGLKGAKK